MKINEIEYDTFSNCFIYLDGCIYEFDETTAKLILEDKVDILIKDNANA